MSDTTTKPAIVANEVGRSLVITAPYGQFEVKPLKAADGGTLLAQFVGIQVGQLVLEEADQVEMFRKALGPELYTELSENYRLPEMTPVAQIALYWQTVGMEAVEAFLSGGPTAALRQLLAQMGVSLSQTSPGLESGNRTLSQAVTANINTPSGGNNAFKKD